MKQAHTFLHNRPRDFDLSLVSWNCRALNVAKIAKISSQADIICLQEVWNKTDIPGISALEPFKTTLRTDRRGGGSLTSYPQDFQISREFKINKDSTLIRFIVHGQRILWLANLYLNQGRITQIQKTFKVIQENIPPEEWASLIVIGDWNTSIDRDDSRVKLIKEACKQLKLSIVRTQLPTRKKAGTFDDFALHGSRISATISMLSSDGLSDHEIVQLQFSLGCTIKKTPLRIPNRKLAVTLTKSALTTSHNAVSFLTKIHEGYMQNKHSRFTNYKQKRFKLDLLEAMLGMEEDTDISEVIRRYWEGLLTTNELMRFSPESREAFNFLKQVFKYNTFAKRDGSIVNAIKTNDNEIVSEPQQVSKLIIEELKKIQYDPSLPPLMPTGEFPILPHSDDRRNFSASQLCLPRKSSKL